MRIFLFLLSITFFPSLSSADELDSQINKACLRHAISLVSRLKTEVISNMDQEQSDQTLKLATASCQAYFKKEFSQTPSPVSTAEKQAEVSENKDTTDWLTESILSGDTVRKEGNKRLMRKK